MDNINSKIVETKIKLELLKNQEDIKKYLELSNTFNVKSYFDLIRKYNLSARTKFKDEIENVEKSREVQEYLKLMNKEYVLKYISIEEELAYLEMLLNEDRRER